MAARSSLVDTCKSPYVCAGLLDILKIDKNSTDLQCFILQFRGLGALFLEVKPTNPLVATGLNIYKYNPALLFTTDI